MKVKWWVWLVVILIGFGIFNSANGDNDVAEADKTSIIRPEDDTTSKKNESNSDNASDGANSIKTSSNEKQINEIDPKKLNGRGRSDVGREEPQYEGMIGFVAASSSDVIEISDSQSTFPKSPWDVHTIKQVGENKFKDESNKVAHKTKVKVIKQMLTHEGFSNYDGALLVEDISNNKQFFIDVYNFVTFPYWEENIIIAVDQGNIIAVYNGKGDKPMDRDGEWVELEPDSLVIADSLESGNRNDGKIKAYVYKEWAVGYGGVDVYFDPESLSVKY